MDPEPGTQTRPESPVAPTVLGIPNVEPFIIAAEPNIQPLKQIGQAVDGKSDRTNAAAGEGTPEETVNDREEANFDSIGKEKEKPFAAATQLISPQQQQKKPNQN